MRQKLTSSYYYYYTVYTVFCTEPCRASSLSKITSEPPINELESTSTRGGLACHEGILKEKKCLESLPYCQNTFCTYFELYIMYIVVEVTMNMAK